MESSASLNRSKIVRRFLVYATYALFALLFWPFFEAILFAVLFGFAFNPLLQRMKRRWPQIKKDSTHVLILLGGMVFVVVGPLLTIIINAAVKIGKVNFGELANSPFIANVESKFTEYTHKLDSFFADFGMDISAQFDIKDFFAKAGQKLFTYAGAIVTQAPSFLFQFFIFLVVLYYVLVRRGYFHRWFENTHIFTSEQLNHLSYKLQNICNLVLISSVVVGAVQATIISLAWAFTGHPQALLVFVITFFISFIPVVGSAGSTTVLALLSLAQGEYISAVVIVVAGVIAGAVDNVIRAYMFSAQEESTHPFVSFLTIMGGVIIFGIPGLFLGPIIAELAFKIGETLSTDPATYKKLLLESADDKNESH